MLQQGLHFEVILTFHLDGLRWSSRRASRDVLLQLGHMEDIVDCLNLPLRSSLYAIFPMRSITLNGPTNLALSFLVPARWRVFEESSTSSPTRCFYSLWCLFKVALLVVLCSLQVVLGILDWLARCAERSELHHTSYPGYPQWYQQAT